MSESARLGGRDGRNGKDGKDGKDGRDGKDGCVCQCALLLQTRAFQELEARIEALERKIGQ